MAASKASAKAPAFQFYPKDFLSDSKQMAMSLQEAGAYTRLLCYCWIDGSIPDDLHLLARLVRATPAQMQKFWPAIRACFKEAGKGRLIHPRLEHERRVQREHREERSEAGKKGAERRWQKMAQPSSSHSGAIAQPMAKNSSSSASSSASASAGKERTVDARSARPIFRGQRFVVFEWMLDDLRRMLGTHTDGFDLHAWFFDLDAQLAGESFVVPQRDGGRWLQDRTLAEAIRRGLPLAAQPSAGKTAGNAAAAARFIARGQA